MNKSEYDITVSNFNKRLFKIAMIKPFINMIPIIVIFTLMYCLVFKYTNVLNNPSVNKFFIGIIILVTFLIGIEEFRNSFNKSKTFVSSVYMDSLIYYKSVGSEYFDYMLKVSKVLTIMLERKLYCLFPLALSYVYIIIIKLLF